MACFSENITSHVVHDCATFQIMDIYKRKVDWNYKNISEVHWKTKELKECFLFKSCVLGLMKLFNG